MDLFRRGLRAKRAHRLCYLDTLTASCVEPEDRYGVKSFCGRYTYVGITVRCLLIFVARVDLVEVRYLWMV